ncbi:MAG: DUF2933 domain-containing protein [Deinococcota bacterium]|jgi:hypothetical protein|nr:DUF2933 domain-containing protein [Deinococcota bacterium]
MKMCFNWKVLAGVAAVGLGIYLFDPSLALATLPLLVVALCPLMMLVMMWGMKSMNDGQGGIACSTGAQPKKGDAALNREQRLGELQAEFQRLQAEQANLAEQITALEEAKEPAVAGFKLSTTS